MKTVQEWSLKFDQYYNNITSNQAPGLEEYEKSVFLTDAQKAVVLALYNGTLGKPFESTEDVANYLAPLVKQAFWEENPDNGVTNTITKVDNPSYQIVTGSSVFKLPSDLMFRTYESCNLNVNVNCNSVAAVVVPVTQDEYWRTSRNPFKGPNDVRVLRLIYSDSTYAVPASQSSSSGQAGSQVVEQDKKWTNTKYSEIVSKYDIVYYLVRYISNPHPIILTSLNNSGLDIDGETDECPCLLDEALHETILNEAVKIAKSVWMTQ